MAIAKDQLIKQINDGFALPSVESGFGYFSDVVQKIYEKDVVCRPNCKFCNHPARIEAERVWEKTRNFQSVLKFFSDFNEKNIEDKTLPDMSFQNIKPHLLKHYEDEQRAIFVREYSEHLREIVNYKINRDRMFEELSAMLSLKLMQAAADPRIDFNKSVDAITKLVKSLTEIWDLQAKLRGELATSDVIINKFQDAFLCVIRKESDDNVKRKLVEALDVFQEKIEMEPKEEG
jgi:hypothetical protein